MVAMSKTGDSMSKGTVRAVREGDRIVIRMPIGRLIEIVERQHGVKVEDLSQFVAEILADMNEMLANDLSVVEDNFAQAARFALEDGSISMINADAADCTLDSVLFH
jgi:hypothetical protein